MLEVVPAHAEDVLRGEREGAWSFTSASGVAFAPAALELAQPREHRVPGEGMMPSIVSVLSPAPRAAGMSSTLLFARTSPDVVCPKAGGE